MVDHLLRSHVHAFDEPADTTRFSRLDGRMGAPLFGRLFAAVYQRYLDRALPQLIGEFDGLKQ